MRIVLALSLLCSSAGAAVRWGAAEAVRERVQESFPSSDHPASANPSPEQALLTHPAPWRLPAADVTEVVDGDTLMVRLGGVQEKIRFAAVNAPESHDPCGPAATARTRVLAGGRVHLALVADGRDRDAYGRLLRHPYLPDGRSLEAVLVSEGLALAWRDGTLASTVFTEMENKARREGVGCLWGTP